MAKKDGNPLLPAVKKSVGTEIEQKVEVMDKIESLATLSKDLVKMRERANVEARVKDLKYIEQMDEFAGTILEALTEPKAKLAMKKSIMSLIETGQVGKLQQLMAALGITMDKREMLLGFDDTRAGERGKKRLKLQIAWKGSTGETVAASAEVEG